MVRKSIGENVEKFIGLKAEKGWENCERERPAAGGGRRRVLVVFLGEVHGAVEKCFE